MLLTKNDSQLSGSDLNRISIEALPYCIFKPDLKGNEDLKRFSIFIDTSFKMTSESFKMTNELQYWNHTLFSLPMIRRRGDSNFTSIGYPDSSFMASLFEIPLIQMAKKRSKFYFFLKLLNREPEGDVPLAFLDHGAIHLIDRDQNVYSSIKEFVGIKYGCVDKYLELVKDDENRVRLSKNMSVNEARAILRNDFVLWWRHHPTDSLGVLDRFLDQMDSLVQMQSGQRRLLDLKIKKNIALYPICACSAGIVLFDRDVSSLILSVLTYAQYIKYIQGRYEAEWLLARATDRLDTYYILERKMPIEKENEILDREVFGPT